MFVKWRRGWFSAKEDVRKVQEHMDITNLYWGRVVKYMVLALCYKSEGQVFETR
jgi:hypothetical protein